MQAVTDNVNPGAKWKFDAAVSACFDNMLARSIPQYEEMRALCFELGKRYVRPFTDIVDLGASRGEALQPFVGMKNCRSIAIETSDPMLAVLRERFASCEAIVEIVDADLRTEFPPIDASLVLSVLTLQFIPIEYRQRVIQHAFDGLRRGGAMIVVEKILGSAADLNDAYVDLYYAMKSRNGYTDGAIAAKRRSLEGVLVPLTAEGNESLLRAAGFRRIECFWRWLNFCAWIAIKD